VSLSSTREGKDQKEERVGAKQGGSGLPGRKDVTRLNEIYKRSAGVQKNKDRVR